MRNSSLKIIPWIPFLALLLLSVYGIIPRALAEENSDPPPYEPPYDPPVSDPYPYPDQGNSSDNR